MGRLLRGVALALLAILPLRAIAQQQMIGGFGGGGPATSSQIIAALGYTPANQAGDTFSGAVGIANSLSGSSATSSLSLTPTWNTTGTPTAIDLNVAHTASNAASLLLNLRLNSASMFSVDKNGGVLANGTVRANGAFNTLDGRYTMVSGPSIDLRGGTVIKLFQSDGATPINLQTGGLIVPTGTVQYMGSAGGTADALTATPTIALTAYTTGAFYIVKATATNATTTPTINISSLGAKTIVKRAGTALAAGDIVNGANLLLVYDGTNMQLLNPIVN
jgi:hypothetical protein